MEQSEHWPNAPLVFVLAVIRISEYPNFEKRLDNIHEALLGSFPERLFSSDLNIQVNSSEPIINQHKNFRIISSKSEVSVLLRDNLIAIEWARYVDFSEASQTIASVVEASFGNLPHLTIQYIGLRYVNAILESDGDTLERFVHEGLLGSPAMGQLISSTCGSAVELEGKMRASITLHRSTKRSGDAFFPPGIEFPPSLTPNRRLQLFASHDGGYGLLDVDGGVSMKFQNDNKEGIMPAFESLRESMRPVFRSAVSQEAIDRWRKIV